MEPSIGMTDAGAAIGLMFFLLLAGAFVVFLLWILTGIPEPKAPRFRDGPFR